jgi:glycosyltransferase involved in cell wall biosynthesis
MKFSVIICTHNPRVEYLERTLQALRVQTLPTSDWELLLVDNRSATPLSEYVDLAWHPNAIHLREDTLGLTPARLCGIANSRAEILVFVDDDNLLSPDYLELCGRIHAEYPFLGAWGGQQLPEFETEPPASTVPFLSWLACRTLDKVTWANLLFCVEVTPFGAGACICRKVAVSYKERVLSGCGLITDRVGHHLTSCGDYDMAFTASDCGLGMGLFPELTLIHLIPAVRVQPEYILRVIEGTSYSMALLRYTRGLAVASSTRIDIKRWLRVVYRAARWILGGRFKVQAEAARERGTRRALKELEKLS